MNKKVKEISICLGIAILTIAISLSAIYGINYLYYNVIELLKIIVVGFLVCVAIGSMTVTIYHIRNTKD